MPECDGCQRDRERTHDVSTSEAYLGQYCWECLDELARHNTEAQQ